MLSEVEVPAPLASDVDVTEEAAVDEFMVMEDIEDDMAAVTAGIGRR